MTEIYTTEILDLVYKSRSTVLDMLHQRGYDTTDYNAFTIDNIKKMIEDTSDLSPLDIRCKLASPEQENRLPFVYVKYRFVDKLKNKLHSMFTPVVDITGIVDTDDASTVVTTRSSRRRAATEKHILDGYNRLTDELIIICGEHVGEAFHKAAIDAYSKYGYRVSFFYLPDLVVNRLNHVLVPPHIRVPQSQHDALLKHLMVTSKSKMIIIRHHEDIIGRMLGLYPGDIVEIHRPSKTAGQVIVYRHCA